MYHLCHIYLRTSVHQVIKYANYVPIIISLKILLNLNPSERDDYAFPFIYGNGPIENLPFYHFGAQGPGFQDSI